MNASRKEILTLYRNILKTAKYYPSIKRDKIIVAIKEGMDSTMSQSHPYFHNRAKETDPKKIGWYIQDGYGGLKQLEKYKEIVLQQGDVSLNIGEDEQK